VKRVIFGAVALVVGVAGVVAYTTIRRDQDHARLVTEGDTAIATERPLAAVEAYSGAITLKPDSMLAYLKRGETYRRLREWTAAIRDLSQAARLDPTATRPLERLGDVHYTLGRFGRAAERYAEYVALDDQAARVLYKLALARHRNGMGAPAIAAARQAIALDDEFAEAHYLLGVCLFEDGELDEAAGALSRALELSPTLSAAREELALLYRELGRSRDEIDQLQALAALEPDNAAREIALGLAFARAGRTDQAVLTLGRTAERHPNDPAVHVAAGRVWLEQAERQGDRGALAKALEALQRPVAVEAASSETLTLLGRAFLLASQPALAEPVLGQATDLLPVDSLAFSYLAEAAIQLEHFATARDALVDYEALEGGPTEPAARAAFAARIAQLSLRAEEPAVAAVWLRRALEADDSDLDVWAQLVDAEIRAGDLERARETLRRALAVAPSDPALLALASRAAHP